MTRRRGRGGLVVAKIPKPRSVVRAKTECEASRTQQDDGTRSSAAATAAGRCRDQVLCGVTLNSAYDGATSTPAGSGDRHEHSLPPRLLTRPGPSAPSRGRHARRLRISSPTWAAPGDASRMPLAPPPSWPARAPLRVPHIWRLASWHTSFRPGRARAVKSS